jgi:hypothetical protein
MNAKTIHLVYPGGPNCNPNCPGEGSMYHDGYADGHEAGEQYGAQQLAANVRSALPEPPLPAKPDWIHGPTRSHWTREGIRTAVTAMGFRRP